MKTWVLVCALVVSVTAQFPPTDLPSTCASTTCLVGTTCKEVLRPTSGVITGQCLNNVQPTGNENVCGQVGQPLYTLRSGQTVEAFCGLGPSRMDCPSGYQCNIAPNDAYAVCCPSAGGGSTKPGQCPAPVTDGSVVGICANTCSVDSDCSGALKCCRNECGATTCQQPMDAQPVSACAAMLCPRGTRCVEQQVQCIRAPCPPQASCVPVEKDGVCPAPRFSWSLYWSRGWCQRDCRMDADCPNFQKCCGDYSGCGTMCQNPDPPLTCANAECQPGHTCVMQQVQCVRAPCFPVPNCIEIANACNPPCGPGYRCEMQNNRCNMGGYCGRSPQCVRQPVCQPPCGPDYDCKWQRSGYCFFGYCPTQAQCVLRPRCPLYPAWINPNCVRRDDCSTSDPNACSNGLICCSTDCGRRCVRPQ